MDTHKTDFPKEWLEEVTGYFLGLGFFRQFSVFESKLISHLERVANADYLFCAGPLNPADESKLSRKAEQILLTLDKDRVWFTDCEADFQDGDYWYLRALLDWSHISQNRFKPQHLSEIWLPRRIPDPSRPDIDEQPIRVSFTLNGNEISIDLEEHGGWFDSRLIEAVNEAIHDTGFQFAAVQCISDQCAFVCYLALSEIHKLRAERGWKFHEEFFHDSFRQI